MLSNTSAESEEGMSEREQVEVCTCEKRIVRVDEKGEFWRLEGSGEVYKDHHWHKPAPVSQPVAAQEEKCYVCHTTVEWPDDNDPQFDGKTSITAKCGHYFRKRKLSPQAEPSESTETFYCFDREAGVSMCETQCATCRQKGSSQVSIADDASNGVYRAMLTSTAMEYARRNRHEKPTINDLYNAAIELLSRASQPSTLPQSSQQAQGYIEPIVSAWDLIDAITTGDEKSRYIAAELQQYRQRFGKKEQ